MAQPWKEAQEESSIDERRRDSERKEIPPGERQGTDNLWRRDAISLQNCSTQTLSDMVMSSLSMVPAVSELGTVYLAILGNSDFRQTCVLYVVVGRLYYCRHFRYHIVTQIMQINQCIVSRREITKFSNTQQCKETWTAIDNGTCDIVERKGTITVLIITSWKPEYENSSALMVNSKAWIRTMGPSPKSWMWSRILALHGYGQPLCYRTPTAGFQRT